MLTFFSCKKEEKPTGQNGNGLTMLHDSLTLPAGWTCFGGNTHWTNSYTKTIVLDINEDVFIGGDHTLMKYENNHFQNYPQVTTILNSFMDISSMVEDHNNNLWIGCNYINGTNTAWYARRGIIKFDGIGFTQYTESNSGLHNGIIHSVAVDSSNNKWFGTRNSLVKFDESNWTFFDSTNSSLKEFYPVICISNTIWVGGHNSLTKFDGVLWQEFNQSNSLFPASGVRILESDNLDNLWFIGFSSNVLWKFDGVNFTSYSIPIELPNENSGYYTIKPDNQNNIWLGGNGKLVKFDGTNWTNYSAPTYVPGGDPKVPGVGMKFFAAITDIVIKADSSIWMASSLFPIMKFKE